MREIKFRAWDNIEECFVYLTLSNGAYITPCLNISPDCKVMEPWQQYTGVKDKNGREIYEGDILKSEEYDLEPIIFPIKWDVISDCCVNGVGFNFGSGSDPKSPCECEVIGNIYENKDLLK